MTKLKSILVVLCLAISSSLAFAQHEDLILKYHEKNNDFTLKALLKNVGVIDNNTSAEELLEVIAQFYQEKDIVNELDQKRHEYLVEGVSNARAKRRAKAWDSFSQIVTPMLEIPGLIAADNARSEARAKAEAAESMEKARQYWDDVNAKHQADVEAANQIMSSSGVSTSSTRANSGSVRDLYTSDMNWNKMVDNLNQQYGPEKTRKMVQEMRNQQILDRAQATSQSSIYQQQAAQNQVAQVREMEHLVSAQNEKNVPDNGTVISAITGDRTQIYILLKDGVVNSYARRKDSLGRFNWTYVNTMITDIKYTPYYKQFENEYAKAANIPGIGYVFFN